MTTTDPSELVPAIEKLTRTVVRSVRPLGGGRNSQVYEVHCQDSAKYIAKVYFRHEGDPRDRQAVEVDSLRFMRENGVRPVPGVIAEDRGLGLAIFEFLEGRPIDSRLATEADVEQCVQFLISLNRLKDRDGSERLPDASEAFFSIEDVVGNLWMRLDRLAKCPNMETHQKDFHDFLNTSLMPSVETITAWCTDEAGKIGIGFASRIGRDRQTLSPSDFGFHNALKTETGRIIFLDFEYFGWDDPAKMVCDFILHPGMELRESLKRYFFDGILEGFHEYEALATRIKVVYPLFGLKWCLIILNEFLPREFLRRNFSAKGALDRRELQMKQLAKARLMLERTLNEYENFTCMP
ncbi:MAG: aminoglycoside phosphotransferase family protein [Desulfomonile tiedjei]|nr:aminoglycoside phosphotransferase family protein [Desulfomonile tiedjei]